MDFKMDFGLNSRHGIWSEDSATFRLQIIMITMLSPFTCSFALSSLFLFILSVLKVVGHVSRYFHFRCSNSHNLLFRFSAPMRHNYCVPAC